MKTNYIAPTMAAAAAPYYDYLPIELRPPYCIIREGIAPILYNMCWKFSPIYVWFFVVGLHY